jgi:hypothetical protein
MDIMDIMDGMREFVDDIVSSWYVSDSLLEDEGCAFCGCILDEDEVPSGTCIQCRVGG